MDDRAVVALQIGREPRASAVSPCAVLRPARRDRAEPFDSAGDSRSRPYYLTCPHLVAAVSRLEAAGGVERWTRGSGNDRSWPRASAARTRSNGACAASWQATGTTHRLDLGVGGAQVRHWEPEMPARPRGSRFARPGYEARRARLAELSRPLARRALLWRSRPRWLIAIPQRWGAYIAAHCARLAQHRLYQPCHRQSQPHCLVSCPPRDHAEVLINHLAMSTLVLRQWAEGKPPYSSRARGSARRLLRVQTAAVAEGSGGRIGSVFTLAELTDSTAVPALVSRDVAELPPGARGRPA